MLNDRTSQIHSPFKNVDFSDRFGEAASAKQLALETVRLEDQLRSAGKVVITDRTIDFIESPEVAGTVRDYMVVSAQVDLGNQELPILLRAAILEASLNERLADHLGAMEHIQIAPRRHVLEVLAKPGCSELIAQIRDSITANSKEGAPAHQQELLKLLEASRPTNLPYDVYVAAFGNSFRDKSRASSLFKTVSAISNGTLSIPTSHSLGVEHLGGRDSINEVMQASLRNDRDFISPCDEAYSNDRIRGIFAPCARFEQYHIVQGTGAWYQKLEPGEKRWVTALIKQNLSDAECIQRARVMFPGAIPTGYVEEIIFRSLTSGRLQLGLTEQPDKAFHLDLSANKTLDHIAIGCQQVLDLCGGSEIRTLTVSGNEQVFSSEQRRARNGSLFDLFDGMSMYEDEKYAKPIAANNLWAYLGVQDNQSVKDGLFTAFRRLYGETFRGTTGEESWTFIEMHLTREGDVQCRYRDSMYGDADEERRAPPWSLFEAVAKKDSSLPDNYIGPTSLHDIDEQNDAHGILAEYRARYIRQGLFHPNIAALTRALKAEAISFDPLLDEAMTLTSQSLIQVERALLDAPRKEARSKILAAREHLHSLGQFVTPDPSQWLVDLGLESLSTIQTLSREKIQRAFVTQIQKLDAFPDHHRDDQVRMKQAAQDQQRLVIAKDELNGLMRVSSTSSVSCYVGRPLALFTEE